MVACDQNLVSEFSVELFHLLREFHDLVEASAVGEIAGMQEDVAGGQVLHDLVKLRVSVAYADEANLKWKKFFFYLFYFLCNVDACFHVSFMLFLSDFIRVDRFVEAQSALDFFNAKRALQIWPDQLWITNRIHFNVGLKWVRAFYGS